MSNAITVNRPQSGVSLASLPARAWQQVVGAFAFVADVIRESRELRARYLANRYRDW